MHGRFPLYLADVILHEYDVLMVQVEGSTEGIEPSVSKLRENLRGLAGWCRT